MVDVFTAVLRHSHVLENNLLSEFFLREGGREGGEEEGGEGGREGGITINTEEEEWT